MVKIALIVCLLYVNLKPVVFHRSFWSNMFLYMLLSWSLFITTFFPSHLSPFKYCTILLLFNQFIHKHQIVSLIPFREPFQKWNFNLVSLRSLLFVRFVTNVFQSFLFFLKQPIKELLAWINQADLLQPVKSLKLRQCLFPWKILWLFPKFLHYPP